MKREQYILNTDHDPSQDPECADDSLAIEDLDDEPILVSVQDDWSF